MITLQFSTTNEIVSGLIRVGTWSWASHMDMVLPDGNLIGATARHGVAAIPPRKFTRVERYTYEIDFDAYLRVLVTQIGKPYDWGGVIGLALRRNWNKEDAWQCSELHAWASAECGKPLVRGEFWRIVPANILMNPELRRVA